ncbi:conserved Plasmodium protein, unknown function [Plasmodium gallinaceum]|uniref:Uncharacterized protein n=1 Tax=Plasmodium gallinaceum TaxID=5849 RepID=A0A1J1GUJ4_PLAGA|nr:conserved Plasmodium protein, unknown function [Plasmodium gallinaceum]CRG96183.1 conserved Plasmodium protein, unknown function [Plasmodium gallinaceum]
MNLHKFLPIRNIFFSSKNTIHSLKKFSFFKKISENDFCKPLVNNELTPIKSDIILKNYFFFNNMFLFNIKIKDNSIVKKPAQELYFKNKKTKLALRRKRKRMGERVSLRYR